MIFKNLFGNRNSLLLKFDPTGPQDFTLLQEQITEVTRYYELAPLSQLVSARGIQTGKAAILFSRPRKELFLRVIPWLNEENYPYTVFIHPSLIGLNRLSEREEMEAYRGKYPDQVTEREVTRLLDLQWTHPEKVETELLDYRTKLGPLPLEGLSPTRFGTTWGKLLLECDRLAEVGYELTSSPSTSLFVKDLAFSRRQLGREVGVAMSPRHLVIEERGILSAQGIRACVVPANGAVDRKSDLFALSTWDFSA